MDKKTISQPLYKGRSLTACMENAFQLFRADWWKMIKAAWIPLSVYAIGNAILAVSMTALQQSVVWSIIGLLMTLIGALAFFGLFYYWLARYRAVDEFVPQDFKKNIKGVLRQSLRFLVVHVPVFILVLILFYIGLYGCLSSFIPTPYSIPLWVGILAFLVLVYLSVPLTVFSLDYLVGHASYYPAFVKGLTMGTRRWGAFFALGFMVVVIYTVFSMIIGLPLEVSMIIEVMNRVSMSEGNPYALPAFFPIIKFFLTAILSFIMELAFLYPLLSLILLYTSRETLLKERKVYEKQQKKTEKTEKM